VVVGDSGLVVDRARLVGSTPRLVGPWVVAAVAFLVYATYSLTRFRTGHMSGYDLGIFTQVVSRYAHLQAPDIGVKLGWNALGDHFSPALALLAPFYRLVPRPQTLLVAQAALTAVSVVPVTRAAGRVVGPRAGLLVGVAYAGSYGLQSMIGFDFHEVALAVPCLAFGLERHLNGDSRRAAVLLGLLVFVKEDLGVTVLLFAIVLAFRGERRLAAALAAWAVTWFVLATAVIIPALSPDGTYRYFHHFVQNGSLGLTPHRLLSMAASDGRAHLLIVLLLTGVFIAVRSPLALLTLGTLSWRLASQGPGYMDTHVHYDAVLMPIVFMASLDALRALQSRPTLGRLLRRGYPWAAATVMVVLTVAAYPFPRLLQPGFYASGPQVASVQRLLTHVPHRAGIRTDNNLVPLMVSRNDVTMLYATHPNTPIGQWLITDLSGCSLNAPLAWKQAYLNALAPYTLHTWRDGTVELIELNPGTPAAPTGVTRSYDPC
jgi:uncharacterized membrane protein